MNLFDLFEGAIDDLEARRIEDLEAKMDDFMARAKESNNPKYKEAMRHAYAKAKAERDSYYKLNVEEETDTNYTYTVFIDGTKEGTYGSKEEAKAVVKRKKEQAPGREYTIRPKSRTSMSSIKKFQRNRDRNIDEHGGGGGSPRQWHSYVKAHRTDEDDLITAEGFALTTPPDQSPMDPAKKWKIIVRQLISDYIKNPRGLYHLAQRNGPGSPEAFAYNQIMHPSSKIPLPSNMIDNSKGVAEAISKKDLVGRLQKDLPKVNDPKNKDTNPVKWTGPGKDDYGYTGYQGHGMPTDKQERDSAKTNKGVAEASMNWAAHKSTGPKFSGYLKGTDPAPTEFDNKSVGGMEEGIDGNMTVRSNPLSQPLRKRNYVAKNAQSSGAGKHNNNLKAAAARGQVKHKGKPFELDEMTDDEVAKIRKDAEAYTTKQMTAPKKVEPKKSFMQQVGDKQIGMVKGAWKGLTGQLEESDNFMTWAVRNGYNFTKDPAIYESARKKYKALVESKGLGKRVRVVSGPATGQTGTIGEVRNGAFKGAPKYYTVDLDNGSHVQVRKEALRLVQSELAESLKPGEYYIWTVYFDDGSQKRIKVNSDEFDPYAYYAKKNQVVVNVDYDWSIQPQQ